MYRIVYYEEDRADSREVEIVSAENKSNAAQAAVAVRKLMQGAMRTTARRPIILITLADDAETGH